MRSFSPQTSPILKPNRCEEALEDFSLDFLQLKQSIPRMAPKNTTQIQMTSDGSSLEEASRRTLCEETRNMLVLPHELLLEDQRLRDSHVLNFMKTASIVERIKNVLTNGGSLKLVADGTSGTYFVRDSLSYNKAVFKPIDEEANAPNNPKGHQGDFGSRSLRPGVLSGELGLREVAAYIIDRENYHGVPPTTLINMDEDFFLRLSNGGRGPSHASIDNKKIGSLQEFIEQAEVACNYSSDEFPVSEVHKIAILDIRILNCDRNEENMLAKRLPSTNSLNGKTPQKITLFPIDHGLSLPSEFSIFSDEIAWMEWSQAKKPFGQAEKEFIQRLNPEEDALLLSKVFDFDRSCLLNMKISGMVLKKGAEHGLSLYEIGNLIYKRRFDEDFNEIDPPREAPVMEIIRLAQKSVVSRMTTGRRKLSKSKSLLALVQQDENEERTVYMREETDLQNSSFSTNLSSNKIEEGEKVKRQSATFSVNDLSCFTPNVREKQNELTKMRSFSMNDELVENNNRSSAFENSPGPKEKLEMCGPEGKEKESVETSARKVLCRSNSVPDIRPQFSGEEVLSTLESVANADGVKGDTEELERSFLSSFRFYLEEYLKRKY